MRFDLARPDLRLTTKKELFERLLARQRDQERTRAPAKEEPFEPRGPLTEGMRSMLSVVANARQGLRISEATQRTGVAHTTMWALRKKGYVERRDGRWHATERGREVLGQ